MKLEINYTKVSIKFFDKHKDIKDKFITNIGKFISGESVDIKALKGIEEPKLYRMRVGKFRVVFWINDKGELVIINVINADSRGCIYKGV
ncbi:hypothetical protein CFT85387_08475 [Campylobacter fetus subsp. testudinum]|uniref:type II toxin-antitoxin system RelE family toxin n=1 Tax=Campylobacter fetus TaxID=196 RepID=UPI0008189B20|nr:hypothetical protein [Campylobacter fetus]OCR99190.1 hypothetical protein CFT85387_08475 [Campylobacter fetus subsp. testudinum]